MARKLWLLAKILVFLVCVLILWVLHRAQHEPQSEKPVAHPITKVETISELSAESLNSKRPRNADIIIAAVACGSSVEEIIIMMKSALLFSPYFIKIRFIIFSNDDGTKTLKEYISKWPNTVSTRLFLELHPITFPSEKRDEWRKLFKPCASQRLFLPSLLENIDSVLYVDTDTIFLASPTKVWDHFTKMSSAHLAALTPEHEDSSTGWYNRFARHPYYGNLGVNSGVMLMNLTRMRHFGWERYIIPIYEEYKTKITWGDQDIINIVFHYHPEKLHVYPCHFNFRPDHCMYMSVCKSAEQEGIYVLHGSRGSFHNDKQAAFKAIYSAIYEFDFGNNLENLLDDMRKKLMPTTETNCGKLLDMIIKVLREKSISSSQ